MATGNDDLLFGQPTDLEEAVDTLIAFYGEDHLRNVFQDGNRLYDSKPIYGIAEIVRNHWFLWWHPNHDSNWFPASRPPLLAFFHGIGVTHPDDMTDIIFSCIWHHFKGKPYHLAKAVQSLQTYWKEQGYPNGKPDTNML